MAVQITNHVQPSSPPIWRKRQIYILALIVSFRLSPKEWFEIFTAAHQIDELQKRKLTQQNDQKNNQAELSEIKLTRQNYQKENRPGRIIRKNNQKEEKLTRQNTPMMTTPVLRSQPQQQLLTHISKTQIRKIKSESTYLGVCEFTIAAKDNFPCLLRSTCFVKTIIFHSYVHGVKLKKVGCSYGLLQLKELSAELIAGILETTLSQPDCPVH